MTVEHLTQLLIEAMDEYQEILRIKLLENGLPPEPIEPYVVERLKRDPREFAYCLHARLVTVSK